MKRILALGLALLILLGLLLPAIANATEITEAAEVTETTEATTQPVETNEEATEPTQVPTEPAVTNSCGENLTWSYDKGVLTVSGSGAMDDYEEGGAPWNQYREDITTVVFTGGVTYIGTNAFRDYDSLVAVDFGDAMHTIGERAFQSCGELTAIHLPSTFRRFAKSCFEGCVDLKEVYCAGSMPSFNMNCLWNYGSITVYCPAKNPWPASLVEELETNFGGRLQVLTAEGDDIYDFGTDETEETAEVTEATTEPTEEPTTEPTAEPATEPTTEPTAEPTTEPTEVTEETTQPAEETTLPTEAAEETEPSEGSYLAGKSWIALVIIAGILTVLIAGALIVRSSSRGRYSR